MDTVKIRSVNKEFILSETRKYLELQKILHPELIGAYLFGSFVKGTYAPGSDIDILLVLEKSDRKMRDRIPQFLPGRFPVGMDIFPYTKDELDEALKNNTFIQSILQEGIPVSLRKDRIY